MKNIKHILLVFLLSFSSFSCTDFLDVRPENEMLFEELWQKKSEVEAVVMACYRAMQEDAFMQRVIVWGEFRSDNMVPKSGAGNTEKQINEISILANNAYSNWASFYQVINYCNTILEFAPDVVERDANFTVTNLHVIEAEVKAIRALCYFYLVRTFRDIPWTETATTNDEQNLEIPQITAKETLEKITADLLWAEEWAMEKYVTRSETKGRMTKDAIRALLADVYLWQGEYAKCIEYCDKLINATTIDQNNLSSNLEVPKYKLIETEQSLYSSAYMIFYVGNSSESIFEMQYDTETNNTGLKVLYGDATQDRDGVLRVNPRYITDPIVFENVTKDGTDVRMRDFILMQSSAAEYRPFKYMGEHYTAGTSGGGVVDMYAFKGSNQPINWIFYRITDIMLMKAEALVQLNRSEEDLRSALHLVNTTYMRSNPTLLESDSLDFANYKDPITLEKLVLRERQRELMFEGKRWFDLVRLAERRESTEELVNYLVNKYDSNITTIKTKLSVMNALYMPIHQDELNRNTLLKQNPYYESSSSIKK